MSKTTELPEETFKKIIEEYREKFEQDNEKNFNDKNEYANNANTTETLTQSFTDPKNNKLAVNNNKNDISFNKKLLAEFEDDINYKINKKLSIFLNKTLVNIAKSAKKNYDLLKVNKDFWLSLEEEISQRTDSLTNEQITDLICAFAKTDVEESKFLDDIEDIVMETNIPFSVILLLLCFFI